MVGATRCGQAGGTVAQKCFIREKPTNVNGEDEGSSKARVAGPKVLGREPAKAMPKKAAKSIAAELATELCRLHIPMCQPRQPHRVRHPWGLELGLRGLCAFL